MNTVTVYWTPYSHPSKIDYANLLYNDLEHVLKTLKPSKNSTQPGSQYISCSSAKEMYKNTFVLTSPIDSEVNIITKNNSCFIDNDSGFWQINEETIKDRRRIDLDVSYLFFSEESIDICQYPAYLHQTSFMETSTVASGKFNISKWIRPINISFILWKNKNSIKINKDEPLSYVNFETDKKVILKKFKLTEEIYSIVQANFIYRNLFPFTSLNNLYDNFIKSNRNKIVLNLIKNNLTENHG